MQTLRKLPISRPARNATSSKKSRSNMGLSNMWFQDSVAHEARLGELDEIIKRGHVGDRQTFHAVEKTELEKIRLEKSPRRRKYKTRPGGPFAGGEHLFGRQSGISVHGAKVLGERAAREMEQVGFEMAQPAAHLHRFMHKRALPGGLAAVVEAHLAVGIPAGVANPASQILRHAGHGVGIELR